MPVFARRCTRPAFSDDLGLGSSASGDGCLAFQGRNRLEEGSCGVLTGGYGYVRVPEGGDLRADQGVCVGAYWLEGVFPLHLANKAQVRAGCGAKL